jgi:hypothetical protein
LIYENISGTDSRKLLGGGFDSFLTGSTFFKKAENETTKTQSTETKGPGQRACSYQREDSRASGHGH